MVIPTPEAVYFAASGTFHWLKMAKKSCLEGVCLGQYISRSFFEEVKRSVYARPIRKLERDVRNLGLSSYLRNSLIHERHLGFIQVFWTH